MSHHKPTTASTHSAATAAHTTAAPPPPLPLRIAAYTPPPPLSVSLAPPPPPPPAPALAVPNGVAKGVSSIKNELPPGLVKSAPPPAYSPPMARATPKRTPSAAAAATAAAAAAHSALTRKHRATSAASAAAATAAAAAYGNGSVSSNGTTAASAAAAAAGGGGSSQLSRTPSRIKIDAKRLTRALVITDASSYHLPTLRGKTAVQWPILHVMRCGGSGPGGKPSTAAAAKSQADKKSNSTAAAGAGGAASASSSSTAVTDSKSEEFTVSDSAFTAAYGQNDVGRYLSFARNELLSEPKTAGGPHLPRNEHRIPVDRPVIVFGQLPGTDSVGSVGQFKSCVRFAPPAFISGYSPTKASHECRYTNFGSVSAPPDFTPVNLTPGAIFIRAHSGTAEENFQYTASKDARVRDRGADLSYIYRKKDDPCDTIFLYTEDQKVALDRLLESEGLWIDLYEEGTTVNERRITKLIGTKRVFAHDNNPTNSRYTYRWAAADDSLKLTSSQIVADLKESPITEATRFAHKKASNRTGVPRTHYGGGTPAAIAAHQAATAAFSNTLAAANAAAAAAAAATAPPNSAAAASAGGGGGNSNKRRKGDNASSSSSSNGSNYFDAASAAAAGTGRPPPPLTASASLMASAGALPLPHVPGPPSQPSRGGDGSTARGGGGGGGGGGSNKRKHEPMHDSFVAPSGSGESLFDRPIGQVATLNADEDDDADAAGGGGGGGTVVHAPPSVALAHHTLDTIKAISRRTVLATTAVKESAIQQLLALAEQLRSEVMHEHSFAEQYAYYTQPNPQHIPGMSSLSAVASGEQLLPAFTTPSLSAAGGGGGGQLLSRVSSESHAHASDFGFGWGNDALPSSQHARAQPTAVAIAVADSGIGGDALHVGGDFGVMDESVIGIGLLDGPAPPAPPVLSQSITDISGSQQLSQPLSQPAAPPAVASAPIAHVHAAAAAAESVLPSFHQPQQQPQLPPQHHDPTAPAAAAVAAAEAAAAFAVAAAGGGGAVQVPASTLPPVPHLPVNGVGVGAGAGASAPVQADGLMVSSMFDTEVVPTTATVVNTVPGTGIDLYSHARPHTELLLSAADVAVPAAVISADRPPLLSAFAPGMDLLTVPAVVPQLQSLFTQPTQPLQQQQPPPPAPQVGPPLTAVSAAAAAAGEDQEMPDASRVGTIGSIGGSIGSIGVASAGGSVTPYGSVPNLLGGVADVAAPDGAELEPLTNLPDSPFHQPSIDETAFDSDNNLIVLTYPLDGPANEFDASRPLPPLFDADIEFARSLLVDTPATAAGAVADSKSTATATAAASASSSSGAATASGSAVASGSRARPAPRINAREARALKVTCMINESGNRAADEAQRRGLPIRVEPQQPQKFTAIQSFMLHEQRTGAAVTKSTPTRRRTAAAGAGGSTAAAAAAGGGGGRAVDPLAASADAAQRTLFNADEEVAEVIPAAAAAAAAAASGEPSGSGAAAITRASSGTRGGRELLEPRQTQILETEYYQNPHPPDDVHARLSRASGLTVIQTKRWFVNRRTRDKKKAEAAKQQQLQQQQQQLGLSVAPLLSVSPASMMGGPIKPEAASPSAASTPASAAAAATATAAVPAPGSGSSSAFKSTKSKSKTAFSPFVPPTAAAAATPTGLSVSMPALSVGYAGDLTSPELTVRMHAARAMFQSADAKHLDDVETHAWHQLTTQAKQTSVVVLAALAAALQNPPPNASPSAETARRARLWYLVAFGLFTGHAPGSNDLALAVEACTVSMRLAPNTDCQRLRSAVNEAIGLYTPALTDRQETITRPTTGAAVNPSMAVPTRVADITRMGALMIKLGAYGAAVDTLHAAKAIAGPTLARHWFAAHQLSQYASAAAAATATGAAVTPLAITGMDTFRCTVPDCKCAGVSELRPAPNCLNCYHSLETHLPTAPNLVFVAAAQTMAASAAAAATASAAVARSGAATAVAAAAVAAPNNKTV